MTPKVIFRYSWIYDENWKEWIKLYKNKSRDLSIERILKYIQDVEKDWRKIEKSIMKELSKVTHLKWHENINCYVVSNCIPFSDPLTLRVYDKKYKFIDVLIHELIHQIFAQGNNLQITENSFKHFEEKYPKENFNTIIHIVLYAVHKHIYLKFFGEKRLKEDQEFLKDIETYRKAWEIVEKEGYKNIIDQFTKRLNKKP